MSLQWQMLCPYEKSKSQEIKKATLENDRSVERMKVDGQIPFRSFVHSFVWQAARQVWSSDHVTHGDWSPSYSSSYSSSYSYFSLALLLTCTSSFSYLSPLYWPSTVDSNAGLAIHSIREMEAPRKKNAKGRGGEAEKILYRSILSFVRFIVLFVIPSTLSPWRFLCIQLSDSYSDSDSTIQSHRIYRLQSTVYGL